MNDVREQTNGCHRSRPEAPSPTAVSRFSRHQNIVVTDDAGYLLQLIGVVDEPGAVRFFVDLHSPLPGRTCLNDAGRHLALASIAGAGRNTALVCHSRCAAYRYFFEPRRPAVRYRARSHVSAALRRQPGCFPSRGPGFHTLSEFYIRNRPLEIARALNAVFEPGCCRPKLRRLLRPSEVR